MRSVPVNWQVSGPIMSSVAVLSGPERRRRWSAAEKARIVEESFEAGAVVVAVAHRHDVHPNLLHHWRRLAKQAARFVPVRVPADQRPSVEGGGVIEIELDSGIRVRVDGGVDEAALGRVLRALGR
jgi:transposase